MQKEQERIEGRVLASLRLDREKCLDLKHTLGYFYYFSLLNLFIFIFFLFIEFIYLFFLFIFFYFFFLGWTDEGYLNFLWKMYSFDKRYTGLFCSLSTAKRAREEMNNRLKEELGMEFTEDDKGVFCSVEKAIMRVVKKFGTKQFGCADRKEWKFKIGMDAKSISIGSQDLTSVHVGIVPLDLPENQFRVQSPYSVFPIAIVPGKEKDVKETLGRLWREVDALNKKGDLLMPILDTNGEVKRLRELRVEFIDVMDLSGVWDTYSFGGFNQTFNCPWCDVKRPTDRGRLGIEWKTGSKTGFKDKRSFTGLRMDQLAVCILHMRKCVVNQLMEFLLKKAVPQLSPTCTTARKSFEDLMKKIGVRGELYKNGEVPNYDGKACRKILRFSKEIDDWIWATMDGVKKRARPDDHKFVDLFSSFNSLLGKLNDGSAAQDDDFNEKARRWGKELLFVIGDPQSVRIYPHILIYHGKDLVVKFGPLSRLSQEGFEHQNALQNRILRRHTNNHLKRILKKAPGGPKPKSGCEQNKRRGGSTGKEKVGYNMFSQVFLYIWGYHEFEPTSSKKNSNYSCWAGKSTKFARDYA